MVPYLIYVVIIIKLRNTSDTQLVYFAAASKERVVYQDFSWCK